MTDLVIRVFEWEGMQRVVINGCYFNLYPDGAVISEIEKLFRLREILIKKWQKTGNDSGLRKLEKRLATLPSGHKPQDIE